MAFIVNTSAQSFKDFEANNINIVKNKKLFSIIYQEISTMKGMTSAGMASKYFYKSESFPDDDGYYAGRILITDHASYLYSIEVLYHAKTQELIFVKLKD